MVGKIVKVKEETITLEDALNAPFVGLEYDGHRSLLFCRNNVACFKEPQSVGTKTAAWMTRQSKEELFKEALADGSALFVFDSFKELAEWV